MDAPFIEIAEGFYLSPQITVEEVLVAKSLGVTLVINNRPDGEEAGQPAGAAIEAAALQAGLNYVAIPVGRDGVGPGHIDAFNAAMADRSGPVLAFCRSGTRSAIVRAMALARSGAPADGLIEEAAAAGFDLSHQAAVLRNLNATAGKSGD